MVQNIVEAASHQTELLSWGQQLWAASCNTQGGYFCSEKPLQTSVCRAVSLAMLQRSECWVPRWVQGCPSSALQAAFLTHCTGFYTNWAFLLDSKCLKLGELTEMSTPRVFKVQIVFPRNVLHSVIIFILLKSKLNFQPSWEDEVCIFHSEITFNFLFPNERSVNCHIWLLWGQWQSPSFLIQNKEKFKVNILLCFHFEAQIHTYCKTVKRQVLFLKMRGDVILLKKRNVF